MGLSVDSVPSLKAWADSLGGITYPLLSDFYPHGKVAQDYGVLRPEGFTERALFVIDKMGIIRYVDVHEIDDQPDNEVLFNALEKLEPERTAKLKQELASQVDPEPEADVVMYCTPWCPDCKRARLFLRERDIDYVEIDISRSYVAAQRVRRYTGGKEITPVIKVRGQVLVEFDPNRLASALGLKV